DGTDVVRSSAVRAQTATADPSSSTAWPRTVVACGALFVVYLLLSIPADTRGFLGTDTGGKVATIELMIERGDWDPDVEYWAASLDPGARFHGLIYTPPDGERYVNVTSLPIVLLARPLYALGGYRAALALPMIGGLLVALAARAMVDRLRGDHTDGWLAF